MNESTDKNGLTLTCGTCGGTGHVRIGVQYAETLDLLRSQANPISGAKMAELVGIRNNAMNRRLRFLESRGWAIGETHGRERLWRAVPTNGKDEVS